MCTKKKFNTFCKLLQQAGKLVVDFNKSKRSYGSFICRDGYNEIEVMAKDDTGRILTRVRRDDEEMFCIHS